MGGHVGSFCHANSLDLGVMRSAHLGRSARQNFSRAYDNDSGRRWTLLEHLERPVVGWGRRRAAALGKENGTFCFHRQPV